ncbi:MAG: tetratricopeptide repeat protein [Deinococcales bacterium]
MGKSIHIYAANLNSLALMLAFQGRYAEAEPLYREALELAKKTIEMHPQYAAQLNSLENY